MKCLIEEINFKVEFFCFFIFNLFYKIILWRMEVLKIIGKMKVFEERFNGVVSIIYLLGMLGCGKS